MDGYKRNMIAFRAGITSGSLDILSDNDDGEEHQLQKGLRDPGNNDNRGMRTESRRKRDQSKECEYVCTPHRTDYLGNAECKAGIKPTHRTITMDSFLNMLALDQLRYMCPCLSGCKFV